jgi:hypothetical protein
MEPTLRQGQTVLVSRERPARVGDVVLLDARGWLELHRLVDRIEVGPRRWFVHLGDASSASGLAGPADILGVVATAAPRPVPARRAHLRALLQRVGALLEYLGLCPPRRNRCSAR